MYSISFWVVTITQPTVSKRWRN